MRPKVIRDLVVVHPDESAVGELGDEARDFPVVQRLQEERLDRVRQGGDLAWLRVTSPHEVAHDRIDLFVYGRRIRYAHAVAVDRCSERG